MWRRSLIMSSLIMSVVACVVTETTAVQPGTPDERLHAHLELARGYLENRDIARARKPLRRAFEINRSSWEVHDLYGVLYEMEGVTEEIAREAFRLAAAKIPFSTEFVTRQVM